MDSGSGFGTISGVFAFSRASCSCKYWVSRLFSSSPLRIQPCPLTCLRLLSISALSCSILLRKGVLGRGLFQNAVSSLSLFIYAYPAEKKGENSLNSSSNKQFPSTQHCEGRNWYKEPRRSSLLAYFNATASSLPKKSHSLRGL